MQPWSKFCKGFKLETFNFLYKVIIYVKDENLCWLLKVKMKGAQNSLQKIIIWTKKHGKWR